jgi:protein required for attachment to host cells
MHTISIPHEALVFVGDGSRAIFLRNRGPIQKPDLVIEHVRKERHAPTRDLGTDRLGHVHARFGSLRVKVVAA